MQDLFGTSAASFYLGLLLLGGCVGSFLNVVALRLPKHLHYHWRQHCHELFAAERPPTTAAAPPPNLVYPPSYCPHCHARIRARHNIPLLGYLLLSGKCADCGARISLRYPLLELLTALVTLHAGYALGVSWALLAALVFFWALLALSAIDLEHQLLLDDITLPLLWLGLGVNLFELFAPLSAAVLGAILGYGSLWLLYHLHYWLTAREGMGYGDFKLLAAIGAWLGWQSLPWVVLLASASGTLIALGFMLCGKPLHRNPIPFGGFLAFAAWAVLLWGEQLTQRYLQFTL